MMLSWDFEAVNDSILAHKTPKRLLLHRGVAIPQRYHDRGWLVETENPTDAYPHELGIAQLRVRDLVVSPMATDAMRAVPILEHVPTQAQVFAHVVSIRRRV
jgi:hypothetical protein